MVIDLDSVFYFINNNFTDYLTNYTYIKNNKYYWCENIWGQNLYFHNLFLPNENKSIHLNEWNRICVWNHHNIDVEKKIIRKRCERFIHILNNKHDSLLLVSIDKIKNYNNKQQIYYNLDKLNSFIQKYKCNLLLVIPLYQYKLEPKIVYKNNNILIIYIDSYYDGNGTALSDDRIQWIKLEKILNEYYDFNIDDKLII